MEDDAAVCGVGMIHPAFQGSDMEFVFTCIRLRGHDGQHAALCVNGYLMWTSSETE